MHTRTTTTALLTAGLLLTACSSGASSDTAKPSASPTTEAAATEEAVSPDQDEAQEAYEKAQDDYEKALDDARNALGETLGVHPGTYEVTNSQPEYDDVSLALDDEYIAPGTYTSKGPADGSPSCYWARMQDASGESIITNDLTAGRAMAELQEGEFFKTSGCKPWTKSGS